ncbi:hypothetical protein AM919 [Anaplasma marginale str. St. Maries]|nr:hypothetical protein AM919 [Anaplasma marginale str. St. Maries]
MRSLLRLLTVVSAAEGRPFRVFHSVAENRRVPSICNSSNPPCSSGLTITKSLHVLVICNNLRFWVFVHRPMVVKSEDADYAGDLRRAFDELEDSLTRRLGAEGSTGTAGSERRVSELAAEKQLLEEALMQREAECAYWKATCSEIVDGLNSSIEAVKSILNGREG